MASSCWDRAFVPTPDRHTGEAALSCPHVIAGSSREFGDNSHTFRSSCRLLILLYWGTRLIHALALAVTVMSF